MATWQDIEAVRNTDPALPMADIARRLGVCAGWVRATFHRKEWSRPPAGYRGRKLNVATATAVVADYKTGMRYCDIASRNGIAPGYVAQIVKRCAPEAFTPRPRGRQRRIMCAGDLWGA